jgi:hypothetical protein
MNLCWLVGHRWGEDHKCVKCGASPEPWMRLEKCQYCSAITPDGDGHLL